VPTESGFGAYRAVESDRAATALRTVVQAVATPVVVHCCAPDVPLDVVTAAGATGVALDLALVDELDPLGEALDAGLGLLAGAAPTASVAAGASARTVTAARPPSSAEVAEPVRQLWQRLGFPAARLAAQVVVTPACGLAGATPEYARAVLAACRDAGRRLAED
jgi:methionine synthase II (cobalamin-independent)